MQDPNTFLLIPLIQSERKRKIFTKCQENGELSGMVHSEKETTELQFKRFYCSASKIPDQLMKDIVEQCIKDSEYAENLCNNVFNNEIVTSHEIRYKFQINVLKNLISELQANNVVVPDSMFDRLGSLMGMKEGEYVERVSF